MLRTHLGLSRTMHSVVVGLVALAAFGTVDALARPSRSSAGSDLVSMRRYAHGVSDSRPTSARLTPGE